MIYYDLIRDILGKDNFEKYLNNEPIKRDSDYDKIDITPGSGFHKRERKRRHGKIS